MAIFPDKANPGPAADKSLDSRSRAITPSDSVKLSTPINAVYVGGVGDINYVSPDGTTAKLTGCLAGQEYPLEAVQILATGTSATLLIGISSKALR
jgi:hypothetical protein